MKTDLQTIPGVGPRTEADLVRMGYQSVASLRGADPEALYKQDCVQRGFEIDRCQLYVYRCAVYFAETKQPDPEKCKWWYWKDHEYQRENEAAGER